MTTESRVPSRPYCRLFSHLSEETDTDETVSSILDGSTNSSNAQSQDTDLYLKSERKASASKSSSLTHRRRESQPLFSYEYFESMHSTPSKKRSCSMATVKSDAIEMMDLLRNRSTDNEDSISTSDGLSSRRYSTDTTLSAAEAFSRRLTMQSDINDRIEPMQEGYGLTNDQATNQKSPNKANGLVSEKSKQYSSEMKQLQRQLAIDNSSDSLLIGPDTPTHRNNLSPRPSMTRRTAVVGINQGLMSQSKSRQCSPHAARSRTVSMPTVSKNKPLIGQLKQGNAANEIDELAVEYYRLRSFSITPNGICKLGDILRSKLSPSCSVKNQQLQTLLPSRLNKSLPLFSVAMLGAPGVGKTTITYQFTNSDYICAYDLSLDGEYAQKTVCISLNGEEAELNILDIPAGEMSVETFSLTYNVDVFVVVYSITDICSFQKAEDILRYLWNNEYMLSKGVILVGNKADMQRRRQIPTSTGRKLALSLKCKFIETSSALGHNIDELLVGIFAQVMLNPKRERHRDSHCGAMGNGRHFLKQLLSLGRKSHSCENLFTL